MKDEITKTAEPQPRPSAVKSVKTAKGHTLAAVKGGKLVKIAECVRDDITDAKTSNTAKAAHAAPQPPKPIETFRDMVARHFRERQAVAPLWIKPRTRDVIPTPSGWIPRAKLAALVALKARQAKEHHAAIMGRPAEVFAEVLDMYKGDPRAALFAAGITFHDDRGDGRLHVPLFGRRRPVLEAWKKVATLKGYKFAAEKVGA